MAKKQKSTKVDIRTSIVILATAVVLGLLIVLVVKDYWKPERPDVELQGTEGTQQTTQPGEDQPPQKPDDPSDPSELPEDTTPQQTQPPAEWETLPPLDETYEEWLAAAMYMAGHLQYPGYELVGIYAASETAPSNSGASLGVYMHIRVDGREILLCGQPLSQRRTQAGTTDLHTAQLGYATFDEVSGVDLSGMIPLDMNELVELIDYSMLVSLDGR